MNLQVITPKSIAVFVSVLLLSSLFVPYANAAVADPAAGASEYDTTTAARFSTTTPITSYTASTTTFRVPLTFTLTSESAETSGPLSGKVKVGSLGGMKINAAVFYDSEQVQLVNYHPGLDALDGDIPSIDVRATAQTKETNSIPGYSGFINAYDDPTAEFPTTHVETVNVPVRISGITPVKKLNGINLQVFGDVGTALIFAIDDLDNLSGLATQFCENLAGFYAGGNSATDTTAAATLIESARGSGVTGTTNNDGWNAIAARTNAYNRCGGVELLIAQNPVTTPPALVHALEPGTYSLGEVEFQLRDGITGPISLRVMGQFDTTADYPLDHARPLDTVKTISDAKPPVLSDVKNLADTTGISNQQFAVTSSEDATISVQCDSVDTTLDTTSLTADTATTVTITGGLSGGQAYSSCVLTATDGTNQATENLGGFTFADTTAPSISSVVVERTSTNDLARSDRFAKEGDVVEVTVNFDEPIVCFEKPIIKVGTSTVTAADITAVGTVPADQVCSASSSSGDLTTSPPSSATYKFTVASSHSGDVVVETKRFEDRFNNLSGSGTAAAQTITGDTVTVDTTVPSDGPTFTVTGDADAIINDPTPSFTTSTAVVDSNRFAVYKGNNKIAQGAWGAEVTGDATVALTEGVNSLTSRLIDESGNVSTAGGSLSVTLDTTAPQITVAPSAIGRTNDTTPDFTFTANEDSEFTLTGSCASSTASAVTSGTSKTVTLDALTEGDYSDCAVTVTDTAGNVSSPSTLPRFTIDLTGPTVTIIRTAGDTNTAAGATFLAVASGDDIDTSTFKSVEIASASCDAVDDFSSEPSGATAYDGTAVDPSGSNGICFFVEDTSGNVGFAHSSGAVAGIGNFVLTDRGLVSGAYHTKSGAVTATGTTTPGSKVLLKVENRDATISTAQTQDVTFSDINFDLGPSETSFSQEISIPLAVGEKAVWGWIWTNPTDRTTATPAVKLVDLVIDNTAPVITEQRALEFGSSSTAQYGQVGDTVSVVFRSNELIHSVSGTIGGADATCTGAPTAAVTEDITCEITTDANTAERIGYNFVFTDNAGNEISQTGTPALTLDSEAPTFEVVNKEPAQMLVNPGTDFSFTVRVSDDNSLSAGTTIFTIGGIATGTCSVTVVDGDTNAEQECTGTIDANAADGATLTLSNAEITDTAGNSKAANDTQTLFRNDTAAPTFTVTTQDSSQKRRYSLTLEVTHNQHTNNTEQEEVFPVLTGDCDAFDGGDTNWVDTTPTDSSAETYSVSYSVPKGTYNGCTVKVVDEAGNESSEFDLTNFSIRGGSGGSGGSGGFSGSAPVLPSQGYAVTTTVTTQPISVVSIIDGTPTTAPASDPVIEAIVRSTQSDSENAIVSAPITPTILSLGTSSLETKQLQEFLNNVGYDVAETGAGSSGSETEFFGQATENALRKYQRDNGIPETGQYDEQTQRLTARHTRIRVQVFLIRKIVELQTRINALQ